MVKYMRILLVEFKLDDWSGGMHWALLCDIKVSLELKEKLYKMLVRSAMLYNAEYWPLKDKHNIKLSVTKMRMLMWMSSGFTVVDMIWNEHICEKVGVAPLEDKIRESHLVWFGHINDDLPSRLRLFVFPLNRGCHIFHWYGTYVKLKFNYFLSINIIAISNIFILYVGYIMDIITQRNWMYNQLTQGRKTLMDKFIKGVNFSIHTTSQLSSFISDLKFCCPYFKHKNEVHISPDDVNVDIYRRGIMLEYWYWISHG